VVPVLRALAGEDAITNASRRAARTTVGLDDRSLFFIVDLSFGCFTLF